MSDKTIDRVNERTNTCCKVEEGDRDGQGEGVGEGDGVGEGKAGEAGRLSY